MQRAILIVALALLAAAAARAVKSQYREKLDALYAEAEAQRKKLGLDNDRAKLYAQYPTPEINFEGDLVPVGCGQSQQVMLEGHFPKGTSFVVRRDDLQVTGATITDNGWRATLRAPADALPGPIDVEAIAPVSGASRSTRVAEVRGRLTISLEFEDGWKARIAPKDDGENAVEWTKGDAKRASSATIAVEQGSLRISFAMQQEQVAAAQDAAQQITLEAMGPELQKAMEKLQACSKLPQDDQLACIQKLQPDLQRASAANEQRMKELNEKLDAKKPKDAWACTQVELRGAMAHMAGTADCAKPLKVTAQVSCTPPPAE